MVKRQKKYGGRSLKTKLRFHAPPPAPKHRLRSHMKVGGSRLVGGSSGPKMHSVMRPVSYPIAPNRPIPPVTLAFSKPRV
jgi:hypothetical protein